MAPDGRWLAVSMHDVAPATWERCARVLAAVREVADIPVTLLVVPAYHGQCSAQPAFESLMTERLAAGDELALHGYFHCDPQSPSGLVDWVRRRVYTVEGEFASLCEREAAERIHLGQRWFAANGWPLAGFVAPAWLLGNGAWAALRANRGLLYTTTLTRLHLLRAVESLRAPCLTYSTRAAWRRLGSLAWNPTLARAAASRPLLRLGLHPDDAEDPSVRRSWQRCLGRLLEDRRAVTKAEFTRAWAWSPGTKPSNPRAEFRAPLEHPSLDRRAQA
jgi:predicted deacetylase